MLNRKFWMGMLAKLLIFGLTVVGCDNGSTEKGGIETAGRLTINGLGNYNGKYVVAFRMGEPPTLIGAASLNSSTSGAGGRIQGGSVTLKIWSVDMEDESVDSYTGNDQNVELDVLILDSANIAQGSNPEEIASAFGTVTVSFTNGIGSGTASNIQDNDPGPSGPVEPGSPGLTITGLGDYNGKYVVVTRASNPPIIAADSFTDEYHYSAAVIQNGSVTLNPYEKNASGNYVLYTRNDKNMALDVLILDSANIPEGRNPEEIASAFGTVTVSFTNGSASGTVNNIQDNDPGPGVPVEPGLTITGFWERCWYSD